MNAEKELLLALLIEKYTAVKEITPTVHKQQKTEQKLVNRRKHKPHMWTDWEKKRVVYLRDIERLSFGQIGKKMGLRAVQCSATYGQLNRAARRAEIQVQNVL